MNNFLQVVTPIIEVSSFRNNQSESLFPRRAKRALQTDYFYDIWDPTTDTTADVLPLLLASL
jgi:hypothetical protein